MYLSVYLSVSVCLTLSGCLTDCLMFCVSACVCANMSVLVICNEQTMPDASFALSSFIEEFYRVSASAVSRPRSLTAHACLCACMYVATFPSTRSSGPAVHPGPPFVGQYDGRAAGVGGCGFAASGVLTGFRFHPKEPGRRKGQEKKNCILLEHFAASRTTAPPPSKIEIDAVCLLALLALRRRRGMFFLRVNI